MSRHTYYLPPHDPVVTLWRTHNPLEGYTDYSILAPDEQPSKWDTPVMRCRESLAFRLIYLHRISLYPGLMASDFAPVLFN